MVVFLGIRPGQMPEEPQPEGLDPFRDWQAACSVPNRLICSVSGVRDPKDFPHKNIHPISYYCHSTVAFCILHEVRPICNYVVIEHARLMYMMFALVRAVIICANELT